MKEFTPYTLYMFVTQMNVWIYECIW